MIEFTYNLAGIELHCQVTVTPPNKTMKDEPPEGHEVGVECVWIEQGDGERYTVDYDSLSYKGAGLEDLLMDKAIEEYKREVEG